MDSTAVLTTCQRSTTTAACGITAFTISLYLSHKSIVTTSTSSRPGRFIKKFFIVKSLLFANNSIGQPSSRSINIARSDPANFVSSIPRKRGAQRDRKSVGEGKQVTVREELGGRGSHKKQKP